MASLPVVVEITSLAQLRGLIESHQGLLLVVFTNPQTAQRSDTLLNQFQALAGNQSSLRAAKIDVDKYPEIATAYQIDSPPKVVAFSNGKALQTSKTADLSSLRDLLRLRSAVAGSASASASADASGSGSSVGQNWLGASLPRSYKDVTDQIETKRVELLNVDSEKGSVRVLFSPEKPSALSSGKGKEIDWVESDTDEQLLLFMPFQSMLKLHTLQITSVPPTDHDADEDEIPMRPKTIKLYSNRPHNLGFDQAESTAPTQEIEISSSDWNAEGTANIPLRFVKFQNISSLVVFIESGDGCSEKVRLDRLRLIGDSGEKREMGKLEKIGDEPGE